MVALRFLFCLALLLLATIARGADAAKSDAAMEGSPEWVQQELIAGHSDAVINFGYKYLSGNGVPQDGRKAVGFFSRAVGQSGNAEYCMGLAFVAGVGVPHDNAKAIDWFKAA